MHTRKNEEHNSIRAKCYFGSRQMDRVDRQIALPGQLRAIGRIDSHNFFNSTSFIGSIDSPSSITLSLFHSKVEN